MVTHPEPDILECEVKWSLGSTAVNYVSGGHGIPAELFKIPKCCMQYVYKSGKPSSGHRTGKSQSSSQFPRRAVLKKVQTTGQLHSSPMLVRLCSKSCILGFSMNLEIPDILAGFTKCRGTRDQIANIHWIIDKEGNSRKTSTSV